VKIISYLNEKISKFLNRLEYKKRITGKKIKDISFTGYTYPTHLKEHNINEIVFVFNLTDGLDGWYKILDHSITKDGRISANYQLIGFNPGGMINAMPEEKYFDIIKKYKLKL